MPWCQVPLGCHRCQHRTDFRDEGPMWSYLPVSSSLLPVPALSALVYAGTQVPFLALGSACIQIHMFSQLSTNFGQAVVRPLV